MKNKPHKHAALIKAWADGAVIQHWSWEESKWVDTVWPSWDPNTEYRLKPTPAPDIEFYFTRDFLLRHGRTYRISSDGLEIGITFDGDTHEPKSVRILPR